MGHEPQYAQLLRGATRSSVLMTDGYKFSMAQAGFPLRPETFYLALRRGGPHHLPFDFGEVVRVLFADIEIPNQQVKEYLSLHGYALTPAMLHAFVEGQCEVWSPPAGSWVGDGEPILTVTGPSFKVSWLEPLAIMFRFPIQVATAALNGVTHFNCTCEAEAEIVKLVLRVLHREAVITVYAPGYYQAVTRNVVAIQTALQREIHRAFEVGLRAATCFEMHQQTLSACSNYGLAKTSNVFGALRLGLIPVGTTGHEHQQRWLTDGAGFRAMRDMRPSPPSYLFDTYDTLGIGIPTAVEVMREDLGRLCFVRFDSGDQNEQLRRFLIAEGHYNVRPLFIFEDSYTARKTAFVEDLCTRDVTNRGFGLDRARLFYGYGGFVVNPEGAVQFRRDDVGAVYKLSQTGELPVMKTCGSKSSLPGRPVVLVDESGQHLIAQQGETVEGYHPLTAEDPRPSVRADCSGRTTRVFNLCTHRLLNQRDP